MSVSPPWEGSGCWVIAEISANHEGLLDQALQLIRAAAKAGADAVKFQCFLPEEMTVNSPHAAFRLSAGPWAGRRLWDLYAEAATPFDWFPLLWEAAKDEGLIPLASVFGTQSLALIESLNPAAYKIASPETADAIFVQRLLEMGRPVILSTGIIGLGVMRYRSVPNLAVLHCVSEYPTPFHRADLRGIERLLYAGFPVVGLSDHTAGILAPSLAITLGATILEKHLMLGHTRPLDWAFSLTPEEFGAMVRSARASEAMFREHSQAEPQPFQRRWVATEPMLAGHLLRSGDAAALRCAEGLEASVSLSGAVLRLPAHANEPITREMVEWPS